MHPHPAQAEDEPKGSRRIRIPLDLYEQLVARAEVEGVDVTQWVAAVLARELRDRD
jgi:predicted HicB family RNase H-like nuclease